MLPGDTFSTAGSKATWNISPTRECRVPRNDSHSFFPRFPLDVKVLLLVVKLLLLVFLLNDDRSRFPEDIEDPSVICSCSAGDVVDLLRSFSLLSADLVLVLLILILLHWRLA